MNIQTVLVLTTVALLILIIAAVRFAQAYRESDKSRRLHRVLHKSGLTHSLIRWSDHTDWRLAHGEALNNHGECVHFTASPIGNRVRILVTRIENGREHQEVLNTSAE